MSPKPESGREGCAAPSCPVCGEAAAPWLEKRGYLLARCTSCRSAFLPPDQTPSDLETLYSSGYFDGKGATGYPGYLAESRMLEKNFERRLDWIESLHPPGRLLEVGAAYGLFLRMATRRRWKAMGVEIAADCAEEASRLSGVPVVAGDFLEAELPGGLDVICMFDVIEHMRDPIACLRRAHDLLLPGGLLVVETGDISSPWARLLGRRWYFLDPPQHLVCFSAAGLERALRGCGFSGELRRRRIGRWVSLSNIAFKLLRSAPPAVSRIPGRVYLNFGDGMLVAARKP
jgi:SAM-dependent methyltransferase